jgi:hypothetical protein
MYTKENYRNEIVKIISSEGYDPIFIAQETYRIYLDQIKEIDNDMREFLLNIATMENGPEFEMTKEKFEQFLQIRK